MGVQIKTRMFREGSEDGRVHFQIFLIRTLKLFHNKAQSLPKEVPTTQQMTAMTMMPVVGSDDFSLPLTVR